MTLKYEFRDTDFEYEINGGELEDAMIDILLEEGGFDYTDTNRRIVKFMLDNFDVDDSFYDEYYDQLWCYFEDDARDEFEDDRERTRDPLGYVGMSMHDFI